MMPNAQGSPFHVTPPPFALLGGGMSIQPPPLPREPTLSTPQEPNPSLNTQSSSLGFNLFTSDKTSKRTPARITKTLGDIYAISGRFDLAVSRYPCFFSNF